MRTGGISEVARHLCEHYGQPVSRQQVFQWYKRKTENAAGRPFPREVDTERMPPSKRWPDGRPRRLFDLDDVVTWTEPGVPTHTKGTFGTGWRKLGAGL